MINRQPVTGLSVLPHKEESEKIKEETALFLARGGSIQTFKQGESRFNIIREERIKHSKRGAAAGLRNRKLNSEK